MMQKNPITELTYWLNNEREQGAPNPNHAVLSTVSITNRPHSRVVAIREINEEGLIFFTQKRTRKVHELQQNPQVSLVFWFELLQREVIIEGQASALTELENRHYWETYPEWAQIRFLSYAPTSMQVISSKELLENKRQELTQQFQNKPIPPSPEYCGFRIQPLRMVFYAYRSEELSDVWEYCFSNGKWIGQILSP